MFSRLKEWLIIKDLPECCICGLMSDNLLKTRYPDCRGATYLYYHENCLKSVTTNPELFSDKAVIAADDITHCILLNRQEDDIKQRNRKLKEERLKAFAVKENWIVQE